MGWRFKKSKKIGPVRINLSSKGIGYSIGTKGFRISHGADDKDRITTSIPGTGIYSTQIFNEEHKTTVPYLEKKSSNSGVLILTILLLVLAVPFFAPIFQDAFSENTIPEPPQKEMSATEDIESGIKFADDSTLILDVGDSVVLDVIIADESISANDLIIESVILQGDRQDIVGITADGSQFSITANHPGIVNLSVKTSDGVHQTSITQIIIEDPSANVHNGYSADTFYIINTNSRKIHKSGCSYAPAAGSDNRSVVSSVSSYLNDGYAWCSYCH